MQIILAVAFAIYIVYCREENVTVSYKNIYKNLNISSFDLKHQRFL